MERTEIALTYNNNIDGKACSEEAIMEFLNGLQHEISWWLDPRAITLQELSEKMKEILRG